MSGATARGEGALPGRSRLRSIAFYLPQYHQIAENDTWWGTGFTDWVNVSKAMPRFRGHHQPDLPIEPLGAYNLADPAVLPAQAAMAKAYGIDGFCFYHYWFEGRRLLEAPVRRLMSDAALDIPFCLCWANENWTRSWDGADHEVLVAQSYSREDDQRHGEWLVRAFADPRYIRVDGRPLFLVYRALSHPDIKRAVQIWKETARRAGLAEPLVCRVEGFREERADPRPLGLDASVQFVTGMSKLANTVQSFMARALIRVGRSPRYLKFDYRRSVRRALGAMSKDYPCFPCVAPGWDNTPRRPRGGVVLNGSTPQRYEEWVRLAAQRSLRDRTGDTLLFVNAWNEWAEGAHLEPGYRWGTAYLEAHRRALESLRPDVPIGQGSSA